MATGDLRRRLRGLYAVTPETPDLPRLLAMVACAIAGGAALVQYRAKQAGLSVRMTQAAALRQLCGEHGVIFIVNDDVEVAHAVGADGVHVGREDTDPRRVRDRFPDTIIGVSCYAEPRLAVVAAAAGADYVGIGSVFASPTKPGATRASLAILQEARLTGGIPVAAIGGITPDNAALAVAAGADMLAVISSVFEAPDIAGAARALCRPFRPESNCHVRTQPAAL